MNPGHALGCPEPSLEDLIEQACDPTFMAALERTILRDLFGE